MGPWLVGQCDVYPPAASAARQAFQAAFPPAKQTEALAFCKDDVMLVRKLQLIRGNNMHNMNFNAYTIQAIYVPEVTHESIIMHEYGFVMLCEK